MLEGWLTAGDCWGLQHRKRKKTETVAIKKLQARSSASMSNAKCGRDSLKRRHSEQQDRFRETTPSVTEIETRGDAKANQGSTGLDAHIHCT